MTYLGAADLADKAANRATLANTSAEDDGVRYLADAVKLLAEAVAELARMDHRES